MSIEASSRRIDLLNKEALSMGDGCVILLYKCGLIVGFYLSVVFYLMVGFM